MATKFTPQSPDPNMRTGADMTPAKFGHLNKILSMTQRVYADNATALEAGLKIGELYSRVDGSVYVVVAAKSK